MRVGRLFVKDAIRNMQGTLLEHWVSATLTPFKLKVLFQPKSKLWL